MSAPPEKSKIVYTSTDQVSARTFQAALAVGSASGPDQVTTSCIPLEDSLAPQRCEPKCGSSSWSEISRVS
eukprot:scaffold1769_cov132-Skeletonema_dohrnii-CCMP3373.AAC.34